MKEERAIWKKAFDPDNVENELAARYPEKEGKYYMPIKSVFMCEYNHAIQCDQDYENRDCPVCGWNPAVEAVRKRYIRRKRGTLWPSETSGSKSKSQEERRNSKEAPQADWAE